MTSTALFLYLRGVGDLLHRRAVLGTTEDEEENFGIALDEHWQRMAADERVQAEAFIVKRLAVVAPDDLSLTEDFDPSDVHRLPRRAG